MLPVNCAQLASASNGSVAQTQRTLESSDVAFIASPPPQRWSTDSEKTFATGAANIVSTLGDCQDFSGERALRPTPAVLLAHWETFAGNHPGAFPYRDELIGGLALDDFVSAGGPVNFDVCLRVGTQPEVQSRIIGGIETRLAEYRLGLRLSSVVHDNSCSDRAAIRFHALQFYLEPVLFPFEVVAQQGGRFVQVNDEDVHIAVIVEVPKSAAAATMRGGYSRAGSIRQLLKLPFSEIAKYGARRFVGILRQFLLHLRVHAACHHEQIGIAIVVEIDYPRPPADIARFHPNSRGASDIIEIRGAVVVVKDVGVVGEMSLEEIKVTVKIVVAHAHAHARLFSAIVAQRDAALHAFLTKSTVVIVHEEKTRRGVGSHVDVGPSILIEIGCDDRHAVRGSGFCDARLPCHVRKCPIAVVAVKGVLPHGEATRPAQNRDPLPIAIAVRSGNRRVLK